MESYKVLPLTLLPLLSSRLFKCVSVIHFDLRYALVENCYGGEKSPYRSLHLVCESGWGCVKRNCVIIIIICSDESNILIV